jgi:MFS family permease
VYIEPTKIYWRTCRPLNDSQHSFSRDEIAPVILVSLISALRLLGIFLMLPIFSVYAVRYPGASAALAGVAFGIYALVQSILQIPLGWASDRWGRNRCSSAAWRFSSPAALAAPWRTTYTA